MPAKSAFQIAVVGLPEREVTVIQSILRLTSARARAYQVAAPGVRGDIALVDGGTVGLVDEWRVRNAANAAPTVVVTDQAAVGRTGYEIHRPLTYPKLVGTLDRVTIAELKYVPELVIGDGAERNASAFAALQRNAESMARSGYTALVVDDSLALRKHLEIELKLFGIDVHFAETGEQALSLATKYVYDLILLDVMLPGVNGYQVCKDLRARPDKRYKTTPIVLLTGKNSTIDRVKGTMAGCDFYLTKPAKPEKLHEVLRRCLPGLAETALGPASGLQVAGEN